MWEWGYEFGEERRGGGIVRLLLCRQPPEVGHCLGNSHIEMYGFGSHVENPIGDTWDSP